MTSKGEQDAPPTVIPLRSAGEPYSLAFTLATPSPPSAQIRIS
jgi:hypothetical protein